MEPITYGYARVSAQDQNLARQLGALAAFGVEGANVFADKRSGRDFDRPAWLRLQAALRAGDTLAVKSIDRLGRDYDEILSQWRALAEAGVGTTTLDKQLREDGEVGRQDRRPYRRADVFRSGELGKRRPADAGHSEVPRVSKTGKPLVRFCPVIPGRNSSPTRRLSGGIRCRAR